MQRLAPEAPDLLDQPLVETGRDAPAAAVYRVAEQRVIDMRHVDANLVGTPGLELHANQAVMAEPAHHLEMRNRRFAVVAYRHFLAVLRVTPDTALDAAPGGDYPPGHRDILAGHGAGLQRFDQAIVCA